MARIAKSVLKKISYCAVFPPIGIARVGNSPDEYFIGPEVPGPISEPQGGYKDQEGRLKKQAARFRVYAFDDEGKCIGELTSKDAKIQWTVQVANRKASWWSFQGTENVTHILKEKVPEDRFGPLKRNPTIEEPNRSALEITPEPSVIEGENQRSGPMSGTFLDYADPISLGECLTDEDGRLVFLGGNGQSDTVRGRDSAFLDSYANNDWWFDDVSDGPVMAAVKIGNKSVDVRGRAWVVVAPPDYSPHTQNVVTLFDAMLDSITRLDLAWPDNELGPKPIKPKPSFTEDIYPILRRTADLRWVTGRAYRAHGKDRLADYSSYEALQSLANAELAKEPNSPQSHVFQRIRNPNLDPESPEAANQANLSYMPALSGDEGSIRLGQPKRWMHLTKSQYAALQQWSVGDFDNDLPSSREEFDAFRARAVDLESLPPDEQPMALTRGALEACEGGAFFPGIEITSIVRHADFYSSAFRISDTSEPGDLSKWMALPWQADFNDCSDNWWPAVRPDDVIQESYFDEVLETFDQTAGDDQIYRYLTRREPWARGMGVRSSGFDFGGFPGLPTPLPGMTGEDYKTYAEQTLGQFMRLYVRSLPRPRPGELPANYHRRVRTYLSRTIELNDFNFDEIADNEISRVVFQRIARELRLSDATDDALSYQRSEQDRLSTGPKTRDIFAGVMEVTWRRQERVADKNELVRAWSELGVVTKKVTPSGEEVLVETARDKYARLPWRDYFYYLMNIEQYPDFLGKAKELAEEFLSDARTLMTNPGLGARVFVPYSRTNFDAQLEAIYEANRQGAVAFDPAVNPGDFDTEEKIIERIRQLSPFNQLDGGWLQRVTPAGNSTKVQSMLFQIWMDELGNGDPAQNHANIYTDLMRSAGIYYPNVKTKEYAQNPEIWDEMYSGSVYHTAISLFPETYYPELIGMTLYLEWEANDLQRMVDLYEYYGYSSLFYKLHVAIDNTVDGHGAYAKRIVEIYLDEVREESGESGVQEHWERIWNGYIAFASGGVQRWRYHLNNPKTPSQKVREMITRKRHYGALAHHDKKLGPARINALFEEPDMLMEELARSDMIVPGDPDSSRLLKLMDPDGVMFRVFTDDEIEIWKEWIRAMPQPVDGASLDSGAATMVLLRRMAAAGVAADEHAHTTLAGPDPSKPIDPSAPYKELIEGKSVAWWFQMIRRGSTFGDEHHLRAFMYALARPENDWIVLGDPRRSRLVTELLSDGPMGDRLRQTRPLLGGIRGTQILVEWITAECPVPDAKAPEDKVVAKARSALSGPSKAAESMDTFASELEEAVRVQAMREPARRRRNRTTSGSRIQVGPAMGSVQ